MRKILGLDLGTNSIGWALVKEAENSKEQSEIIKLGVRVNPLTADEKTNFEKGRPLSTNADRTLKRGARRNLQRFKLRREELIKTLIKAGFITKTTPLTELGKGSTHETLELRAKSAREKVSLEHLARILLAINKKRGYKSSRKANNEEEGQAIDGMSVAKELYDQNLTPGQYVLDLLENNRKYIPDFYRSDLQDEFTKIWTFQRQFYPTIINDDLYKSLEGKNKTQTWAICQKPFGIEGIKLKGRKDELKKQRYEFRAKAITEQLNLEHLAIVLQEINNDLNQSSGYLGAISDRSKELYFNKETVGEHLWKQIKNNPHISTKNQVFYRQDYLDEFEQIWQTQSQFHKELRLDLKKEIRDIIIFYQRKLKSQKGLLSFCQFESWEQTYIDEVTQKEKKRTVGRRVIPKSSPLFQEFKIWQNLNNVIFTNKNIKEEIVFKKLEENIRKEVFEELNLRGDLKPNDILKIVLSHHLKIGKISDWKCNFDKIEGNRTQQALYNVYKKIADDEGYGFDWEKKRASEIIAELKTIFPLIGLNPEILEFNTNLSGADFTKQPAYQLWHLLYSAEDDTKVAEEDKLIYGNSAVNLKKNLVDTFGLKPEYAKTMANVKLQNDYGNLSSKAISKIIPYLQEGNLYSEACCLAGYNHSNSLTKEENEKRMLADKLEEVKKNSLRNPVVEKILNQMVNVVNQIIDKYGKPDEIRIELARELKKNAKERSEMTRGIAEATRRNDDIKKKISKDFNIPNPTRNDTIRYRLWEELAQNEYKDLFTNRKINYEDLFSKEIDIEHIIPKALLFDDSFSNKTLAFRKVNLKKSDRTALDFITNEYNADLENYTARVESLYDSGKGTLSKAKRNKLLMSNKNLPDGFIDRDLRNSQYIAKKSKEILLTAFRTIVATSGSITDRLREDWDLINVMKELNMPKYKALGMTEFEERLDKGQGKPKQVEVIKDWTKRNDHRHHAMDALTVAFTTHNHIQYLNNLNARKDENHKEHSNIAAIEKLITKKYENKSGRYKRKFIPPMEDFRLEAKKHIKSILVSIKNKNKVVTKNINTYKTSKGQRQKLQLTPRGQLHKETIYGKSKQLMKKTIKLNKNFTLQKANLIADSAQRELVLSHLQFFENNPEIAFDSKTLKKNPLLYKNQPLKDVFCFEEVYTIRKDISSDLKTEKIIDDKIEEILQDRLKEHQGNAKEAFSNLEENPIWLNKEKGISIKRVTIKGVNNVESLHYKKDHLGKHILNNQGNKQPVDFVSTGNNHHVAIYKDAEGNLHEKVISFYEAVERANQGLPIIDKEFNTAKGWEFQFTMKQNEMFVFPNDEFDVNEIDLLDEKKASLISNHLFRVQKISTKDYLFTHHLETQATTSEIMKTKKSLSKKTFHYIQSTSPLKGIVKVRIDHIGRIIQVGEY